MAGDIEEFLRRAAQRREQKAAPPQPQPPRPQPPPPQRPALEPEIIEDVEVVHPGIMRGETVGDHVSEHLDTSGHSERLSQLGAVVDASDDRMEEHLHEVFEHDLGQLGAKTSRAAESTLDDDTPAPVEPPRPEVDVLSMLTEPDSIRKVIILNEILNRPEDRW